MKKISLMLILFGLGHAKSQTPPGTFIVNGKVIGQGIKKIKLYYTGSDNKQKQDSAAIQADGIFTFSGTISEPTMAFMEGTLKSRSSEGANTTQLFLEPALIKVTVKINDFKNAVVTGSKTHAEFTALTKDHEPVLQQMQPLSDLYSKDSDAYRKAEKNKKPQATLDSMKEKLAAIHDQFDPYNKQIAEMDYRFFANHPNSYATAYYLRFYVSRLSLDSLQMFYDNMNDTLMRSSPGKEIAKEIKKLRAGSPGSMAQEFMASDINGNNLSLSSFKGKYVLLDFWASWCVPCRHSSPHLLELYKQYHDNGFDIIGIADDDDKPAEWKKAVAKDSVGIWHHVLRGLSWEKIRSGQDNPNDISEKFGINELPTKILIDKNGVIVARYDKGTADEVAAMDKKIAEVLGRSF